MPSNRKYFECGGLIRGCYLQLGIPGLADEVGDVVVDFGLQGTLFGRFIKIFVSWDPLIPQNPGEDDGDRRAIKGGGRF